MNTKDKIIELLKDHSQKSVIGWSVEEGDFNTLADELLKNFSLHAVVKSFYCDEELGGLNICKDQCRVCRGVEQALPKQ